MTSPSRGTGRANRPAAQSTQARVPRRCTGTMLSGTESARATTASARSCAEAVPPRAAEPAALSGTGGGAREPGGTCHHARLDHPQRVGADRAHGARRDSAQHMHGDVGGVGPWPTVSTRRRSAREPGAHGQALAREGERACGPGRTEPCAVGRLEVLVCDKVDGPCGQVPHERRCEAAVPAADALIDIDAVQRLYDARPSAHAARVRPDLSAERSCVLPLSASATRSYVWARGSARRTCSGTAGASWRRRADTSQTTTRTRPWRPRRSAERHRSCDGRRPRPCARSPRAVSAVRTPLHARRRRRVPCERIELQAWRRSRPRHARRFQLTAWTALCALGAPRGPAAGVAQWCRCRSGRAA